MANFYNPRTRKEHEIMVDRAGWGNYLRFTCITCSKDDTVLRKQYESEKNFVIRVKKWLENHPNSKLEEVLNECDSFMC